MTLSREETWFPVAGVEKRPNRTNRNVFPGTGTPADVPGWTLDLVENFTSINSSRWTVLDALNFGGHLESTRTGNVTIDTTVAGATDGSALRQQAKIDSYNGRSYTAGFMYTQGKYTLPNYFRVECRAKVTYQHGMWPAPLWFRPDDQAGAYEIDLIESVGVETDRMHHTLHSGPSYSSGHVQSGTSYSLTDPTGWHTYVIEKTANTVKMWSDGILRKTWTNADSSIGATQWAAGFEQSARRWALWSNLQIGGSWALPPDGTTDWSADKVAMWVDYVYTWVPA